MFSHNQEIQSRIKQIALRIAQSEEINGWDLVNRISKKRKKLKIRNKDGFVSFHDSLELAFLLLSKENTFSQLFWHSYALTYQATNNSFNPNINVNDIKNIIYSLDEGSKKNKSLKETSKKFEDFIIQNGLLRKFSQNQIEFVPTILEWNSFGALGLMPIGHESIDSLIDHGKTLLTKIVFSIYGLKVTSGMGVEEYTKSLASNSDIEFLIKKGLIVAAPKNIKKKYKDVISKDWNSSTREYVNVYLKSEELINQIDFSGEIENDFEAIIGFYGILNSLMNSPYYENIRNKLPKECDSITWGNLIADTTSYSLEILRDLVNSRDRLFYEGPDIDEQSLALIAGLSNPSTIKNIINSGEIVKINDSWWVGIQCNSAKRWVLDKKRKYKVYEPIEDIKPEKNVDYGYLLKEIDKAKEKINESKKKKIIFNDNDLFARTDKEIFGRVADHNKNRWEWIGNGKTYKEIDKKNSIYRKNIIRKTYKENKSPITQDIIYDINSGYIKKIN